jgi:hypothetical protein
MSQALPLSWERKAEIKEMIRCELDAGNTINVHTLANKYGVNKCTLDRWLNQVRMDRLAAASLAATVHPQPRASASWGLATQELSLLETGRPPCPTDFSHFTLLAAASKSSSQESQLHRARPPQKRFLPANPVSTRPALPSPGSTRLNQTRIILLLFLTLRIPAGPRYSIFSCSCCQGPKCSCCGCCCRRRPSLPGIMPHHLFFVTVTVSLKSVSRCNQ